MADTQPPNGNGYHDVPLPKRICIICSDPKREYFPTEQQYLTEKDAFEEAGRVAGYLEKLGVEVAIIPANQDLPAALTKFKPEMAINMVGSVYGNEYLASAIPGMLELLQLSYTGSGILGEALTYNKFIVHKLLQQGGVPVPNYQLIDTPSDPLNVELRFPLISKLNAIHGSVEISADAISRDEKHLRERLKFLIETYEQPVLLEEFIVGREITAVLLEGKNKKIYMGEKMFANANEGNAMASYDAVWGEEWLYKYEKFDDENLRLLTKKAFSVLNMADYAKFDVRLDASGRYYFIDANSNPAFGPKESETALGSICDLYGVPFEEILRRLIVNTLG